MGLVFGTAAAAASICAANAEVRRRRHTQYAEYADRLHAAGQAGPEALAAEWERVHREVRERAERRAREEAKAAARNPRRPDRFDFTWHAAMCAAEAARLRGERPAIDLPWEPAFEAQP
jgi:thioesterase domain-containing protein